MLPEVPKPPLGSSSLFFTHHPAHHQSLIHNHVLRTVHRMIATNATLVTIVSSRCHHLHHLRHPGCHGFPLFPGTRRLDSCGDELPRDPHLHANHQSGEDGDAHTHIQSQKHLTGLFLLPKLANRQHIQLTSFAISCIESAAVSMTQSLCACTVQVVEEKKLHSKIPNNLNRIVEKLRWVCLQLDIKTTRP